MSVRARRTAANLPAEMTIRQVATYLRWDYSKVYRLVRIGKIKSVDTKRGEQMKDRRVARNECRRIKKLKDSGRMI